MYCENCGGKIESGTKFCIFCGAPVPTVEKSSKAESVVESAEPMEQVHAAEDASDLSKEESNDLSKEAGANEPAIVFDSSKPAKPNSKKKIIIAVAGVLCIIAAVVGIFVLGGSPETKMNQAIKNGNVKEGYDIYKEKIL